MILIKFATRSRPNKFVRAMNNIRTHTLGEYRILISCDEDDSTMNTRQVQQFIQNRHRNAVIVYGPPCGKIGAINRDMEHAGHWDILVNMSDDMMFTVRGWDRVMRDKIAKVWGNSTDFFAHFNDGYVGPSLSTMTIIGWDYYQRDGYIYHNSYKSFSCDAEAWWVAQARGRHHYFRDVLFKHNHPANNRSLPTDSLYKANGKLGGDDTRNYFKRLDNDFDLNLPGPHPWDKYKTHARNTHTHA